MNDREAHPAANEGRTETLTPARGRAALDEVASERGWYPCKMPLEASKTWQLGGCWMKRNWTEPFDREHELAMPADLTRIKGSREEELQRQRALVEEGLVSGPASPIHPWTSMNSTRLPQATHGAWPITERRTIRAF